MKILDEMKGIKKYQRTGVSQSLNNFSNQLFFAWQAAAEIKLPARYFNFKNIIFAGMGGSNLASEFVRGLYRDQIKQPLVLVRGYKLPHFVGRYDLVFISSYSGGTEEAISVYDQAMKRGAKILVLTAGGKLLARAKKDKIPFYQISKKYNPSGQPRYALGAQLGAAIALFSALKIIRVRWWEIKEAIEYLTILSQLFSWETATKENPAKFLAKQISNHLLVIVAADFLAANAHIMANQINESAKQFAVYFTIPELNHHLMEGLAQPAAARQKIKFLFLNSEQYEPAIAKRFTVTQKVLRRQKISFLEYQVGGDRLRSGLEIMLFGGWLSFYLAVLNGQNPAVIPWVDFFKKEMAKNNF